MELGQFFGDGSIAARPEPFQTGFQTILFLCRLTVLSERKTGSSMNHGKVTEVGHTFFIQNGKVDICTARGMIGTLRWLKTFFGDSGEHVIIIEVTGETSVPRRNLRRRRWRRNLRHTRCAGPGRNGYRRCCGSVRLPKYGSYILAYQWPKIGGNLNSLFVRKFSPSTKQCWNSLLSNHLVITSD
jgi:hypothetical protein